MLIKIAKLGTRVIEICLDSASVDDAVTAAGLSSQGLHARVGGHKVSSNHPLEDGDIVTLVPARIRGEATIPIAGDKWQVHQNDPDVAFPSNFHAHNLVRSETLDLYTGNVYHPVTKQLTRKLPKKKLDSLLRKVPKRLIK